MLINTSTLSQIQSGQFDNLRCVDHFGHDHGPCAPGRPMKVVRFTDSDGRIQYGLVTEAHPRPEKYDGFPDSTTVWEAAP